MLVVLEVSFIAFRGKGKKSEPEKSEDKIDDKEKDTEEKPDKESDGKKDKEDKPKNETK